MNKLVPILLVLVAAACGGAYMFLMRAPAGAEYTVEDLTVYPTEVPSGGKIYITALVKSARAGTVEVKFNIGGEEIPVETDFAEEGEEKLVAYEYPVSELGELQIRAGDLSRTVTVRTPQPARFEVTRLEVPSQVLKGSQTAVVAEVVNRGEMRGNYQGGLSVAGTQVSTASAQGIDPGERRIVRFVFTATVGGSITLENYTGSPVSLNVVEPFTRFEYVDLAVPSTVYAGEVRIEGRVKNTGNVENEITVQLTVNPSANYTVSPRARLSLKPGQESTVTFIFSDLSAGSYILQFGDLPSKTLRVEPKPEVYVEDIIVPEVAIVGTQIPVKVVVKSGTTGGSFSGTLEAKVEGSTISSESISLTLGSNETREVSRVLSVGNTKGICTLEVGGKAKSLRVLGYKDLYVAGVDWMEYNYTSDMRVPELNQSIHDEGRFKYTYQGTKTVGDQTCREMRREITSSQQYGARPEQNYDLIYAPDTDKEAFLFQALSYRNGRMASEMSYSNPLKIFSFPLAGEVQGSASVTIKNYQPIELTITGTCNSRAEVKGKENLTVAGQTVEATKIEIRLEVSGTATFRGQSGPVTSTTTITRWVNSAGVLLKERAVTSSSFVYMGQRITFTDEEYVELRSFNLSYLTKL